MTVQVPLLYCTVQYRNVQYSTGAWQWVNCTVRYCTIPECTVLYMFVCSGGKMGTKLVAWPRWASQHQPPADRCTLISQINQFSICHLCTPGRFWRGGRAPFRPALCTYKFLGKCKGKGWLMLLLVLVKAACWRGIWLVDFCPKKTLQHSELHWPMMHDPVTMTQWLLTEMTGPKWPDQNLQGWIYSINLGGFHFWEKSTPDQTRN